MKMVILVVGLFVTSRRIKFKEALQINVVVVLVGIGILMIQAACAPSPSACPTATIDTEMLKNAAEGYCLLYPTKYSTEVPGFIIINPASGPGDVLGDAWVSIETEAAAGQTAAQVADAQISSVGPGFNITRKEAKMGGEQAVVVDGLPGPDSWRKVFIVHANRLYTLTFLPWQPASETAGQPTPLEGLYTIVMDSLQFLPQEGNP